MEPTANIAPPAEDPHRRLATIGGLCALALWSSSVALMRSVSGSVGTRTAAALAATLGAAVSLGYSSWRGPSPRAMLRLDRRYLLGGGALFVACNISLYVGIGLAPSHSAALVVGLVNYLWPSLTVALAVPLLGRRAGPLLAAGCLVAVSGTAWAILGDPSFRWSEVTAGGWATIGPLLMGLTAATSWGFYSNLVRRWAPPHGAVPWFVLALAACLWVLRLAWPETSHWTWRGGAELAALGICSLAVSYPLWDFGMRRGNHLGLGLASYLVPIASVALASVYLGVRPGAGVIGGCLLVMAGALICRRSIRDE